MRSFEKQSVKIDICFYTPHMGCYNTPDVGSNYSYAVT